MRLCIYQSYIRHLADRVSDTLLAVNLQENSSCQAGRYGRNALSATTEGEHVSLVVALAKFLRAGRHATTAEEWAQ